MDVRTGVNTGSGAHTVWSNCRRLPDRLLPRRVACCSKLGSQRFGGLVFQAFLEANKQKSTVRRQLSVASSARGGAMAPLCLLEWLRHAKLLHVIPRTDR